MNVHTIDRHLTDGDLVRMLDGQAAAAERDDVLDHVSVCDACAERMESIRQRAEEFSQQVRLLDDGPDQMTRARARQAFRQAQRSRSRTWANAGWLRVAAAVLVVLLAGATVDPLRAWVAEQWQAVSGDSVERIAERTALPGEPVRRGSMVRFQPPAGVFNLEIAEPQAEGTIQISVRDVPMATLEIIRPEGESIMQLPSGLQVENREDSRASYEIILPRDTRLVQIFAGGRPIALIDVPEGTELPWSQTLHFGQR